MKELIKQLITEYTNLQKEIYSEIPKDLKESEEMGDEVAMACGRVDILEKVITDLENLIN